MLNNQIQALALLASGAGSVVSIILLIPRDRPWHIAALTLLSWASRVEHSTKKATLFKSDKMGGRARHRHQHDQGRSGFRRHTRPHYVYPLQYQACTLLHAHRTPYRRFKSGTRFPLFVHATHAYSHRQSLLTCWPPTCGSRL
ncbi:hypothetical protein BOTBODRAFT_345173 [Botryobasidium botryosum FD-172 SS1]|uniref:Uncharacterized protein n=1 Tax=Botryobasidium botryosum (strain FD-172 SS1) TaxID=930990 RepID=A0A067MRM9_BOTB1|nr:hypothetical protein BOTBODRAFT_345173 [Botryobasidium botryosum FD-172 SS1]